MGTPIPLGPGDLRPPRPVGSNPLILQAVGLHSSLLLVAKHPPERDRCAGDLKHLPKVLNSLLYIEPLIHPLSLNI